MDSDLTRTVIELAQAGGEAGTSMGVLVEGLVRHGFAVEHAELEIWHLLQQRRLTPNGFVCRTIRKRERDGTTSSRRVYEFVLVPWSPDLDQQLELEL